MEHFCWKSPIFEFWKENFPTEKRFDISSLVANDADSNSNLRYHFAANVPFRVEQDGSRLYLINSEELDRKIFENYILSTFLQKNYSK